MVVKAAILIIYRPYRTYFTKNLLFILPILRPTGRPVRDIISVDIHIEIIFSPVRDDMYFIAEQKGLEEFPIVFNKILQIWLFLCNFHITEINIYIFSIGGGIFPVNGFEPCSGRQVATYAGLSVSHLEIR